jgi:DNA-binding response OmpR family regulator
MPIEPGRLTKAAIHCEAGEVEVRLSAHGNWQLSLRGKEEREWRFLCSGDLNGGAISPSAARRAEPVRFNNLVIETATRRVFFADREIELQKLQYDLLAMLATDPNRVFTHEEIQREVLGYETFLPRSKASCSQAGRLRISLRDAGAEGFVISCHGVGYKLWKGVPLADTSAPAIA